MSLEALFDHKLPINRKERYYTGTVLPAIVCQNNFQHFSRFLELLGLKGLSFNAIPASADIQFFTEYGFAESVFGAATLARFANAPIERDTPDILIFIGGTTPHLIAIEAKMFDRVTAAELNAQMNRQAVILDYIKNRFAGIEVRHVALLPAKLQAQIGVLAKPVITWEQLIASYEGLPGAAYFVEILDIALGKHESLKAVSTPGINSHGKMSGEAIWLSYTSDNCLFGTVGRSGGINGALFQSDLKSQAWRTQVYEVSKKPIPVNQNWFSISDFIRLLLVAESGDHLSMS